MNAPKRTLTVKISVLENSIMVKSMSVGAICGSTSWLGCLAQLGKPSDYSASLSLDFLICKMSAL